jgi:hypothetical protein
VTTTRDLLHAGLLVALEQGEWLDISLSKQQSSDRAGRDRVSLSELADHLLQHLDWEGDAIFPTIRRMND